MGARSEEEAKVVSGLVTTKRAGETGLQHISTAPPAGPTTYSLLAGAP